MLVPCSHLAYVITLVSLSALCISVWLRPSVSRACLICSGVILKLNLGERLFNTVDEVIFPLAIFVVGDSQCFTCIDDLGGYGMANIQIEGPIGIGDDIFDLLFTRFRDPLSAGGIKDCIIKFVSVHVLLSVLAWPLCLTS